MTISEIYLAKPMSRQNIRQAALKLRQIMGVEKEMRFDIVSFIEYVLCDENFELNILPEDEMKGYLAITLPDKNQMSIREDVYTGAAQGDGWHRFTLAHEVGHYFLHNSKTIKLARVEKGKLIKTYENPEWQADAFAGELLIPHNLINSNMTITEIMKKCNVSRKAAEYQLSAYKK